MKRGRMGDPNKSLTSDYRLEKTSSSSKWLPHIPWNFRNFSLVKLKSLTESSKQLCSFRDIKCYNNTILIILKLQPGLQRENPPEFHPVSERTEGLVMNFNSIILSGILLSRWCVDGKEIKTTPKSQLCSYFNPGRYASRSQHKPLSGNTNAVVSLLFFPFCFFFFTTFNFCLRSLAREGTAVLTLDRLAKKIQNWSKTI